MKRQLIRSSAFIRAAKKFVKKHPDLVQDLQATLELLAEDAYDSQLRTHKLYGEFKGSWACSLSYALRIMFKFVDHEGVEAILLETVGTHEEVY
jgi:addiction module RelE/StbE family toxin